MLPIHEIREKLIFLQTDTSRRPGTRYALEPIIPEMVVLYFENLLQVRLPEDFRSCITQLGNGIGGLFHGLGMRSFRGLTEQGFPMKKSGWKMPEEPVPLPVFALGGFDWNDVWAIKRYMPGHLKSIQDRELRSLLSGGTFDLQRDQKTAKRLYGFDLKDNEYLEPAWLRGALHLGDNWHSDAYLIVAGAPEDVGQVFQAPSRSEEKGSFVGYALTGSFTDFVMHWLERELKHPRSGAPAKTNQDKKATQSDSWLKPNHATRVVFPDLDTARLASDHFINEEGVGFWLSTDDEQQLALGEVQLSTRYALHLPSLDRHGRHLPDELLARCLEDAASIGMCWRNWAVGYWTLSHTGVLQEELVWIVHSTDAVSPNILRYLARHVLEIADQDAVAIELGGSVEVIHRQADR